jgi:murein DD-endopeptidase MepM/ murein hydrolase activator NlpD
MPIEVDPSFKGSGRKWQKRRRARMLKRAGAVAGVAVVVAAVGVWMSRDEPDVVPTPLVEEDDAILVQTEETAEQAVTIVAAATEVFLDIQRDPMILTLTGDEQSGLRRTTLTQTVHPLRAPAGSGGVLLEDRLLDASQRVQLTIPSSSADLAAFEARRASAFVEPVAYEENETLAQAGDEVIVEDGEGSWGAVIGDAEADTAIRYVDTRIENTTTAAEGLRPDRRRALFQDTFVRLKEDRALKDVLSDHLDEAEIGRVLRRLDQENVAQLVSGSVVALRRNPNRLDAELLQMSIYAPDAHIITLAQPGPGRFTTGADPWFSDKLLDRARLAVRAKKRTGDVRLKDAIYSTALRNQVPLELVGELMVMLSRVQDLDVITGEDDRFVMLFSEREAGVPSGRILFAALEGPQLSVQCYVVPRAGNSDVFECFDPANPTTRGGGGGGLGQGYLVPVAGTKTSGFGPRHHPILNKTVNHNGVDWAAPTGTPVRATTGGKISRANRSDSYGNIIYVDHPGGVQSRYAHLNRFADGIRLGREVQAGEVIGYVGTTGRSTGPHLHFEIRMAGNPVDPLSLGAAQGSRAVETLVNRIIQVESAGNARAKNPRSSATGLGQFINSTWLRMMRTYRPDLVASLSEPELLKLRFDPALSRAMVTNLARENESYLRANGVNVTAGRLYLAHFLGPGGAVKALKANQQASVLEIMGAAVVRANPFLDGWSVAEMAAWSDRKMRSVSGASAPSAPAPVVITAEVRQFREAVDAVLDTM